MNKPRYKADLDEFKLFVLTVHFLSAATKYANKQELCRDERSVKETAEEKGWCYYRKLFFLCKTQCDLKNFVILGAVLPLP